MSKNNIIIKFENVSFRYNNSDKEVLSNINIEMEEGKSYALVGPTGQGKSTTASLIANLYTPTNGRIVYKGLDIKEWDRSAFFNEIGFILQEPFLFSGSVLENIIYGNKEYQHLSMIFSESSGYDDTKDKNINIMYEVLKSKNLHDLIDIFPEGLITNVENNSDNISLGQKQIINFLRVILRNPQFLILDEATANLDTVTEKKLQNILDTLPKYVTKLIIAHRLNTIKDVDTVFSVGGGRIERR